MADKIDMEDEDTVTLQEALEVQELQENQSVAVLGASDPENCSYSKGYMKRQALYACLTCNPKGAPFAQAAGICLACSYTCHEGHDLVELFTKRHFRCDCGNQKFPDNPCCLQKEKDSVNAENTYNQNFDGTYCSCHRPYPETDPTSETFDDPMIQCIICEDWYHFQHSLGYLNIDFEAMVDDYEMICGTCTARLGFLGHYSQLALKPKAASDVETPTTCTSQVEDTKDCATKSAGTVVNVNTERAKVVVEDSSSQDSGVDSLTGSDNTSNDASTCLLHKNSKKDLPCTDCSQAVAWKDSLRSSLCRCQNCMNLYGQLKIQFLLDEEDTIEYYEALGRKKTEDAKLSAEASINSQVNRLDHVGQLELVHGYNHFKDKLADFLKEHAQKGKTVRRDDVDNFFKKINEEAAIKRRRLE